MRVLQDLHTILAHWMYTREEWECFLRWHKARKGIVHSFFFRVFPQRRFVVPEITITGMKIWIGNDVESFMDQNRQLKCIRIRDAGSLNILEIAYERINGNTKKRREIRIPIPKGKLREAIEVQESLGGYTV
jgi:hypothetical protein